MSTRLTVNETVKNGVTSLVYQSQDLFYLSSMGLSQSLIDSILEDLYGVQDKEQLINFEKQSADGLSHLTPVEIHLLKKTGKATNNTYFDGYIRLLKKLPSFKSLARTLTDNVPFMEFIATRLEYVLRKNFTVQRSLLIFGSDKSTIDSLPPNYAISVFEDPKSRCLRSAKLLLDLDQTLVYLCRCYMENSRERSAAAHLQKIISIFQDNCIAYNTVIVTSLFRAIRLIRPFEIVNFQILDFNDESSPSGYALRRGNKLSSKWEEFRFKYVLHIQDHATFFNFLVPMEKSDCDTVAEFLRFWFLCLKTPTELNFDGLDSPECQDFIGKLSALLNCKINLHIDLIKFHNNLAESRTRAKRQRNKNALKDLHLETLVTSSMEFFHNKHWSSQLSILCKILNTMLIGGKDEVCGIQQVAGKSPTKLFLPGGSSTEINNWIDKQDLKLLMELWEKEEDSLEDILPEDEAADKENEATFAKDVNFGDMNAGVVAEDELKTKREVSLTNSDQGNHKTPPVTPLVKKQSRASPASDHSQTKRLKLTVHPPSRRKSPSLPFQGSDRKEGQLPGMKDEQQQKPEKREQNSMNVVLKGTIKEHASAESQSKHHITNVDNKSDVSTEVLEASSDEDSSDSSDADNYAEGQRDDVSKESYEDDEDDEDGEYDEEQDSEVVLEVGNNRRNHNVHLLHYFL
ncbi:hypothetical protein CANARDRAFT_7873 [[Candida] arabinofermentans NRRL YB-2248]|uniref:Uncharacterized protein n=1 Tax=[Candida] arabinofermentans NRRL YB-2248 TaxID=983967 RepID=A0A1E4T0F8_9ASCO|nr:hypothetical protein CANARDRAFT_7873 [[Candida] arabinofermentans NRRL YB-2248]